MTREEMLRALQADVNAWPQEVKDAGVKNAAGWAYVPVARNNEVLRTPEDPEATPAPRGARWPASRRGCAMFVPSVVSVRSIRADS